MCENKLNHICNFKDNNRLLVIGHDYYGKNDIRLNSTLNDITIVWNFFRRTKCFNKNQIFIYGDLDLNGKMLPWRSRYFDDNFSSEISKNSNYIYYSGHGYDNGKYDDYGIESSEESFHIIDCCYSYLWDKRNKGIMMSTDGKNSFISISTKKASEFTLKLFDFLNEIYFNIPDENFRIGFENFFRKNNFLFKGDYRDFFPKE